MKQNKQNDIQLLSNRIRQARKNAHISQKELGEGIGVSDKSISSYEKGRSTPPFEKLKHLAKITNKPISYFTQEVETVEPQDLLDKLSRIEKELEEIRILLKKSQTEK